MKKNLKYLSAVLALSFTLGMTACQNPGSGDTTGNNGSQGSNSDNSGNSGASTSTTAFVSDYEGTFKVDLASGTKTKINDVKLSGQIEVSPDAKHIFQASDNTNRSSVIYTADGEEVLKIEKGGVIGWLDNETVAYIDNPLGEKALKIAKLDGTMEDALSSEEDKKVGIYSASENFLSPDGKKIALYTTEKGGGTFGISVVDIAGKSLSNKSVSFGTSQPIWAGDNVLWLNGKKLYTANADLSDVKETSLDKDVKAMKSWTDGKVLISSETRGDGGARITEYYTMNPDGTGMEAFSAFKSGILFDKVFLSADNKSIVYIQDKEVHMAKADGSDDKVLAKGFTGGIQSLEL